MLTQKEKKILENRIYNAIKKGLKEETNSKLTPKQEAEFQLLEDETQHRKNIQGKRQRVAKWLNTAAVNTAAIFYELFNVDPSGEDDNEKKNARSLGYKKLYKEKMPTGGHYDFTDDEVNRLFSLMTNQMSR